MLCVYLAGLPWLRRPEAWMAALLAQMVALPNLMIRLDQGRPFLVSEGVLICLLFAWGRERTPRPSWQKLVLTTAGFALSVWVHGTWYLWVFVLAGFFAGGSVARDALAGGLLGGGRHRRRAVVGEAGRVFVWSGLYGRRGFQGTRAEVAAGGGVSAQRRRVLHAGHSGPGLYLAPAAKQWRWEAFCASRFSG